jgi:hypothetical protein
MEKQTVEVKVPLNKAGQAMRRLRKSRGVSLSDAIDATRKGGGKLQIPTLSLFERDEKGMNTLKLFELGKLHGVTLKLCIEMDVNDFNRYQLIDESKEE